MKLSQVSTDKATDVLCEIAPYATNIFSDEDLMEELKGALDMKDANTMAEKIAIVSGKLSNIVSILLKKRKEDLFGIVGALNDKTAEEVCKQNFLVTMKQIKDISKDKELVDFFKSWADTEESE